jgi:hypothetical protein
MSRLAAVQTANPNKPVRVMIYGIEGVGKSTFGSEAPVPIFITPEGGIDNIPGAKAMPNVATWDDILASVDELTTGPHSYKTVVLDSADWIEKTAHAKILSLDKAGRSIITANGGYGAGYRESEKMHRELIERLSVLREKRGMNVIITAHYTVRTVKDPEAMSDYDAFEIKCHEMVSSLWREWVDALLFVRFKTFLKEEEGSKTRALGDGERVAFTEKRPSYQAKNRYGLPHEMDFKKGFFAEFMTAAGKGELETPENVKKDIDELLGKVADQATKDKINAHLAKIGNVVPELVRVRNGLKTITKGAA